MRRIYNNVQLRLPSAFRDAGSDSEHSADAVSGRHSEASEDGDLKALRGLKWIKRIVSQCITCNIFLHNTGFTTRGCFKGTCIGALSPQIELSMSFHA